MANNNNYCYYYYHYHYHYYKRIHKHCGSPALKHTLLTQEDRQAPWESSMETHIHTRADSTKRMRDGRSRKYVKACKQWRNQSRPKRATWSADQCSGFSDFFIFIFELVHFEAYSFLLLFNN